MKLMDEVAGIVAARHCKTNIVTASVDAINFHEKIKKGTKGGGRHSDLLCCHTLAPLAEKFSPCFICPVLRLRHSLSIKHAGPLAPFTSPSLLHRLRHHCLRTYDIHKQ